MKETISKVLQIEEDVLMRFHADKSDKDGLGNNIFETYAKKDEMEAIEENAKRQNVAISSVTDDVNQVKNDSKSTIQKVESLDRKQYEESEETSRLQADLAEANERIKVLEAESAKIVKDKGVFGTEKMLRDVVVPVVGDSAIVIAPTSGVDPVEYWGDNYLGVKADNLTTWADNPNMAFGLVYTGTQGVLYKVIKHVTIGTLVEPHHVSDAALLNDGIIKAVVYGGAYVYACLEDRYWYNTEVYASLVNVSANTTSDKVLDGDLTQKTINLTSRANDIVGNNNNDSIIRTLNALVDVVNELQTHVSFISESEKLPLIIDKASVTGFSVTGDLHDNLLDISPMPIILS